MFILRLLGVRDEEKSDGDGGVLGWGGVLVSCIAVMVRLYYKLSHPYDAGTEHVGLSRFADPGREGGGEGRVLISAHGREPQRQRNTQVFAEKRFGNNGIPPSRPQNGRNFTISFFLFFLTILFLFFSYPGRGSVLRFRFSPLLTPLEPPRSLPILTSK